MGLIVPNAMEEVIQRFGSYTGPVDEDDLSKELSKATPLRETMEQDQFRGSFAENVAWHFMRSAGGKGEPWGTYWAPVATGVLADRSTPFYSPDVADLDEEILAHWIGRSATTKHPAICARYADLAWDLGRYLRKPLVQRSECAAAQISLAIPVNLAQKAIDGYLEAVEKNIAGDEFHGWSFVERAICLSVSLSDAARAKRTKEILFDYHHRLDEGGAKFMWWRLHDVITMHENAFALSPQEQQTVLHALEKALAESSDFTRGESFDPHKAASAADRLLPYLTDKDEIKRVTGVACRAFESAAEKASGLLALGWLEDLIPRYRKAGLIEDVARIEGMIRNRSEEASSGMRRLSASVEIPEDEIRHWADSVAGSSVQEAFKRIAIACMMKQDAVRKSVYDMQVHAPMASRITNTIMSMDGFTEATIGPVDEDILGRSLQQAANRFSWEGPFLHQAYERTKEKHGADGEALLAYIQGSPFFHSRQQFILREGLSAWEIGDPIKAIHLLVPQVEAACRELRAHFGWSVRKQNPHLGGSQVLTFGDILSKEPFNMEVLKDVSFHLKALYTDPRGINLRNKVAHGLAHENILGMGVANWVVHSILMIASLVPVPANDIKDSNS